MNIALGALVIVLLLLPGLSFKLGVISIKSWRKVKEEPGHAKNSIELDVFNKFSGIFNSFNFSDSIFYFSFIPLVLHVLALCLLTLYGEYIDMEINYKLLFHVLSGREIELLLNTDLTYTVITFLLYCILQVIVAYFLAQAIFKQRFVVSKFLHWVGRQNLWYVFFTAPFINKHVSAEVDYAIAEVLVNTKEGSLLFTGLLDDYFFKPGSRELEYIVMRYAVRRDYRRERRVAQRKGVSVEYYATETGPKYTPIGSITIIPAFQIMNINTYYVTFEGGIIDEKGNFLN